MNYLILNADLVVLAVQAATDLNNSLNAFLRQAQCLYGALIEGERDRD